MPGSTEAELGIEFYVASNEKIIARLKSPVTERDVHLNVQKVKQSRYRLGVAQRVPGS
jgi:hypothetical protein